MYYNNYNNNGFGYNNVNVLQILQDLTVKGLSLIHI